MPPLIQYYDEWEPAWDEPGYGTERILEAMYGHVPGENPFKSETNPQGIVYSCPGCWTTVSDSKAKCPRCGLDTQATPIESLRRALSALQTCSRCGHDLKPEDEGGCPECGAMRRHLRGTT